MIKSEPYFGEFPLASFLEDEISINRGFRSQEEIEKKKQERKNATSIYKEHFSQLPRYKGWLTSSELGEAYGRCMLCKVDVKVSNRRKGLFKHSKTNKHLKNIGVVLDDSNTKNIDDSSDESIAQNKYLNDSAWHDHMFEKGMLDSTANNEDLKRLQENAVTKIEKYSDSDIDESEDYTNSIDPQPDSTNNQKQNSFIEADTNDSSIMSWIPKTLPKVSLKPFHEVQPPSSSSQDEYVLETNQHRAVPDKQTNDINFQPIAIEHLIFGKLITNEMIAINDPTTLAKFKEQILKVIVNLNSGHL
ncbi:hypothetical protein ACFFRR_005219 [Megaselia abdita]